ncbi:hypothetical protein HDU77_008749 [Chytriomyces hyalinus]|nr:hypothetical protein HDU77_008749 [Chytriomyces hyalinus]
MDQQPQPQRQHKGRPVWQPREPKADAGIGTHQATTANQNSSPKNRRHGKRAKKSVDNPSAAIEAETSVEVEDVSSEPARQAEPAASNTVHLSETRFQDLVAQGVICPPTGRALKEEIGHEFLTLVQDRTILEILDGNDCLAQAKTGTGKTLGFLIPSIERLYRTCFKDPSARPVLPHANSVSILVISPTRELAQQITVEAEQLVKFLPFQVQCVIGGTNMTSEARRLNAEGQRCDILVATPGRLLDHLENSGTQKAACANLKVLIFDEADRLLEEGFKREIDKIIAYLPPAKLSNRQTLLFSATIPPSVHQIAKTALLPNFKFITTIAEYESSTHEHVPQFHMVVDMCDLLHVSYSLVRKLFSVTPKPQLHPKIIFFFPTARATQLFAELLVAMLPTFAQPRPQIFEIHSRKSQSARTKATDAFRGIDNAVCGSILVSSDVSARGMDFPNVSHVIQVGAPSSREQYIHRLGRTARAGSAGVGILILAEFERFFLTRTLKDLNLTEYPGLQAFVNDQGNAGLVMQGLQNVSEETKSMAYAAWLGFYNSLLKEIRWRGGKDELVTEANRYAIGCLGCAVVPGISKKTVGKMGLKGVPGLTLVDDNARGGQRSMGNASSRGRGGESQSHGGRGGGGSGGRGGGRGGAGTMQNNAFAANDDTSTPATGGPNYGGGNYRGGESGSNSARGSAFSSGGRGNGRGDRGSRGRGGGGRGGAGGHTNGWTGN